KPTTQYPSTPGFISNHWYGRWGQVSTPLLDKLAHSLLRAQTDSEFDALQGAAGQPDAADHDPEDAP
ncbi:hypothetical protein VDR72_21105, partial [Xanthomonas campestris pv. campestris]|nr:hypothetical protein [Xanthomonas campestris pv. campestris]MEB1907210.1 hypothetical protein [Xanthomonas campestris pv. campestris]MEB2019232.1 hypothetical protein [Xanthomonas campestris pv. campestris]